MFGVFFLFFFLFAIYTTKQSDTSLFWRRKTTSVTREQARRALCVTPVITRENREMLLVYVHAPTCLHRQSLVLSSQATPFEMYTGEPRCSRAPLAPPQQRLRSRRLGAAAAPGPALPPGRAAGACSRAGRPELPLPGSRGRARSGGAQHGSAVPRRLARPLSAVGAAAGPSCRRSSR